MSRSTDDVRIRAIQELSSPAEVMAEIARTPPIAATVASGRRAVHDMLEDKDDRLLVVVGPCSVHDPKAALEYARLLAGQRHRLREDLEIQMRVYFEKPRTTVGWKGLINDPGLDGSFRINEGLRQARGLLLAINEMDLPAACEFLDVITPQYIADLVSWGAIGARTTESQIHREMASGLSCPIGFKNGTAGDIQIAIDAIVAASQPHHFLAVTKAGRASIASTSGNDDCHVVLRGGSVPNYDAAGVAAACAALGKRGLRQKVMIDVSHANSAKRPENQPGVVADICARLERGDHRIMGAMIESNLVAGRQDLTPGRALTYGQSITDGCIDWETTAALLDDLAKAVRARRVAGIAEPRSKDRLLA
ncbi:3-deoxy-7-phosphoheptulonate synthase [Novosphingobium sp. G106]|uniref:3-deoxy-7-phosphoheptulonate synthase n=1 Tax=Novosphingobium sp. G106 TaxID=2849500 RepID=UPI001C2D38D2|nr:3-deoxy-7-phosphoheptulonate synthase [Novosphingobium sp. G106]MBV1687804.1 3-deoxy-7-phosphoheptulonate synthase [Novosphingobium sp. G106]